VVGVFALGINLLSAGFVAKVLSLTAVAYGIVWSLVVIAYGTLPEGNRVAAEYFGYALLIGILYWALYFRRKINSGEAGPPRQTTQTPPYAALGKDMNA
jgi:hypothetical protein